MTIVKFPNPSARRYLGRSVAMREALLEALRHGYNIETSSRVVGIARSTLHVWRKEDASFDADLIAARDAGVAKIVRERIAHACV